MRISDGSSYVCSADLLAARVAGRQHTDEQRHQHRYDHGGHEGRAATALLGGDDVVAGRVLGEGLHQRAPLVGVGSVLACTGSRSSSHGGPAGAGTASPERGSSDHTGTAIGIASWWGSGWQDGEV